MSQLIYQAGLLKCEVIELNIGDVIQNESIVTQIQPVACPYPVFSSEGFKSGYQNKEHQTIF